MFCMAADSFACEPTAPGTQVSVRAQKGLCPGQLAQPVGFERVPENVQV